jgi:hypothetical protein
LANLISDAGVLRRSDATGEDVADPPQMAVKI